MVWGYLLLDLLRLLGCDLTCMWFLFLPPGGIADARRDEPELMQQWFNVVHEKNMLVRHESELMVQ